MATEVVLFGDTFFHDTVAPRLDSVRFSVPVSISTAEVQGVVPEGASVALFCRVKDQPRFAPLSLDTPSPETDYVCIRGDYSRVSIQLRGAPIAAQPQKQTPMVLVPPPATVPAAPQLPPPVPQPPPPPERTPSYRVAMVQARPRVEIADSRLPTSIAELARAKDAKEVTIAALRRAGEDAAKLPSLAWVNDRDADLAIAGAAAAVLLDVQGPVQLSEAVAVVVLDAVREIGMVSRSFSDGFWSANGIERVVALLSWEKAAKRHSLRIRALDTLLLLVDQSYHCAERFCGFTGSGVDVISDSDDETKPSTAYRTLVRYLLEAHPDREIQAVRAVIARANSHAAAHRLLKALEIFAKDVSGDAAVVRRVADACIATSTLLHEFRIRVEQFDVPHGLRSVVASLDAGGFVEILLKLVESRTVVLPQISLLLFELLQCSEGLRFLLEHGDAMKRIITALDPDQSKSQSGDNAPLSVCTFGDGSLSPVNLARILAAHLRAASLAFQLHTARVSQKDRLLCDMLELSREDTIGEEAVLWSVTRYSTFNQLVEEVDRPVTGDREEIVTDTLELLQIAVSWQSFLPLTGLLSPLRRLFKAASRIASGEQGKHLPSSAHDNARDIVDWTRLAALWSEKGHSCIDELTRNLSSDVTVPSNIPALSTALVLLNAVAAPSGPSEDAGAIYSRATIDSLASLLSGIAKLLADFPEGNPIEALETQCDDVLTLVPIATLCVSLCLSLLSSLRKGGAPDFASTPLLTALLEMYGVSCGLPMCPCMIGAEKPATRFGYFICKFQKTSQSLLREWIVGSESSRVPIFVAILDLISTAPKNAVPCFKLLATFAPTLNDEVIVDVWKKLLIEEASHKAIEAAIIGYAGTTCWQLHTSLSALLENLVESETALIKPIAMKIVKLVSDALDTTKFDDHLVIRLLSLLMVITTKSPAGSFLLDSAEISDVLVRSLATGRSFRVARMTFALVHRLLPQLLDSNHASAILSALWQCTTSTTQPVDIDRTASALFALSKIAKESDAMRTAVIDAIAQQSANPFAGLATALTRADTEAANAQLLAVLALQLIATGISCDDDTTKMLREISKEQPLGEEQQQQLDSTLEAPELDAEDFVRIPDIEVAQGIFTQPPLCNKRRRNTKKRARGRSRLSDDSERSDEKRMRTTSSTATSGTGDDAPKDSFRNRKPNTSRAASIHVDQFMGSRSGGSNVTAAAMPLQPPIAATTAATIAPITPTSLMPMPMAMPMSLPMPTMPFAYPQLSLQQMQQMQQMQQLLLAQLSRTQQPRQ